MPKTILITGAKGQLGNELRLISEDFRGAKVLFTDIEELDITNKEAIHRFFKIHRPEICINCAAYTAVDLAEDEPEKAYLINEKAVENIASICSDNNTFLYHISTDFVFDGQSWLPYKEEDHPNPLSVYGSSKLAGEIKASNINPNTTVIRTSWLYSTFGNNFVKTMLHLGRTKDKLGVIYDQVGTPTNAKNLADVIKEMVSQLFVAETKNKVIHFSNEGVASWYDFAYEIFSNKNINIRLNAIETSEFPTKAKRPNFSVLNKKEIKNLLHYSIPHWKDSLKECLLDL